VIPAWLAEVKKGGQMRPRGRVNYRSESEPVSERVNWSAARIN
jgi:hypothetical protein